MADWSFMACVVLGIIQANVISNYTTGDSCISLSQPIVLLSTFSITVWQAWDKVTLKWFLWGNGVTTEAHSKL